MGKIYFLFKAKREKFTKNEEFIVNGPNAGCFERILRYRTKIHFGLDWEYVQHERFLNRIYPNVLLRSLLMAEMVAQSGALKCSVICTTDVSSIRNAIVVVNAALMNITDILIRLKENNNKVVLDILDAQLEEEAAQFADALLCCSRKAVEYYSTQRSISCPVFFVEHCLDRRINAVACSDVLRTIYFGAPENLYLPISGRNYVEICYTALDNRPKLDWYSRLHEASVHYAVRPQMRERVFKPFTKGFIAASCGANILVAADDGDAEFYLGSDYPYLIKEPLSEDTVLFYLMKLKEDFGSPSWRDALEVMRGLQAYTSENVIVRQFLEMIESLKAHG